jgi:hypothetical protein
MITGALFWGINLVKGYGVLPTFALTLEVQNKHTFISLIYFVCGTLVEGCIFAYFLDSVRDIKSEFSMLPEL